MHPSACGPRPVKSVLKTGAPLHLLVSGLLAGLWLLAPPGILRGAEVKSPVRLKINPLIARPRSHSPQMIEGVLNHQFKQMVEGILELRFFIGRRLVIEYDSLPLVVTGEPQRFQITIPPIIVHNDRTPVTVIGRLVSTREVFELGEHDFVVPSYWKRWFILGLCRPDERGTFPQGFPIESALAFERFNPNPSERNELVTYPTPLPPEFFSTSSVAYLPFDILVLEGDGFIQLREPQLQAIAEWVEGGGSLLVYPTGILKPIHLAFLNRLAGGASKPKIYQTDARNRLDAEAFIEKFGRYYSGLGRTVVRHLPQEPEEDPASPEWIDTAAFLWKFRTSQVETIRETGNWKFDIPPNALTSLDYRKPRLYAPQETSIDKPLRELLIPAEVQGIPFWVVATILAVFLVVIAPIDFFFLGAFRARRYTWFTLTAASLAFTVGTIRIAERIMGNVDYRQAFVFVDLGNQGEPVRKSRYEVLFTATQRMLESTYQNSLYVAADNRIPRYEVANNDGSYVSPIDEFDEQAPFPGLASDLPTYSGRVPASYVIRQQLRQWSPAISRQTSFIEGASVPVLNWNRLDPRSWNDEAIGGDEEPIDWGTDAPPTRGTQSWMISPQAREALRQEIGAKIPGARALLFHGSRVCDLTEVASSPVTTLRPTVETTPSFGSPGAATLTDPRIDLVKRVAIRPARGFFSLVSQIGPNGSDGFEDLSLLDSSNPDEWLLVIVVHENDDWVVYRKLYRGKP